MSKEGDRQSVLRTTKVRTALKGDSSWIQRHQESGVDEEEEEEKKPWVAEVRAGRLNSEFSDPVADNTPEPVPSPSTDSSKTSGYLIRGVFTKTDTKPATSSTNGYIGTSGYTKRASEAYKKIAPHNVRSNVEKTELSEPSLSVEEQEKRTETATKMLNSSAVKQRSYVMSAAKKYESTPGSADSSPATAFVAKRVVISDDEDAGFPPTLSVEMSVDEPASPAKSKATPEPTPKQSDTLSALSDTLLSTPQSPSKKPVAQVSSPVPETKKLSKPEIKPRVSETITQATSVAPVATLKKTATTEPKPEPTPKTSTNPKPVAKTNAMSDNDLLDLTESTPQKLVDPVPTNTDLLTGGSLPKTEKTKGSLDLLAVDIIPIDTNTDKLSSDKTSTKIEITQTVVQTKTDVKSTPQKLVDPVSTNIDLLTGGSLPKTEKTKGSLDLLAVDIIPIDTNTDKLSSDKTSTKIEITQTVVQTKTDVKSTPQKLVDPVSTNIDLLTGGSLPKTEKTKGSLDLLAVDIIPIDTNTDKLSSDKTSTKIEITQTVVQTKTDVKSTVQKSANPVSTTTDLLIGGSLPQTQKAKESLDLLAYDVIPFDTKNDRLSTDKTRSKVETTRTVTQTKTVVKGSADPFDPIPIVGESTKSPVELFDPLLSDSSNGQQQTVTVTFEQKSSKSSSPWDKWAVPTVATTTEDSEPKPEPDPKPTDNSSTIYTRTEESNFQDPNSETKKNVVYVKSYLNSSELPRYSTSRYDNDYDYVTSSTSSYAYSSPPSTVGMTACTYCGSLVGNDSKITIDHLNISCHPECFKCGICSKPMGDFIHSMFLHRGTVHCESCYSNVI